MQGTEQTNTGLSSQLDAGVNATGTRVGYWIVQNGNETTQCHLDFGLAVGQNRPQTKFSSTSSSSNSGVKPPELPGKSNTVLAQMNLG